MGIWTRLLINKSIWFTIIGSFFCACGQVFINNSQSKFANTWFNQKNTNIVITICVLTALVSKAMGIIITSFFVT